MIKEVEEAKNAVFKANNNLRDTLLDHYGNDVNIQWEENSEMHCGTVIINGINHTLLVKDQATNKECWIQIGQIR